MTVMVKLFANVRELIGSETIEIDLPDDATVAELRKAIAQQFPNVASLLARSALARNHDYALDTDAVTSTDELAVIPPVSGG